MQKFALGITTSEEYLRNYMLPWMATAGGIMSLEELQHRVALKARESFRAGCPDAYIHPNHNWLNESREPGYFGGGFYFDLQIASPKKDEVSVFLLKCIRKQSRMEVSDVTKRFRKEFEMTAAIILVDPNFGQPFDLKSSGKVIDRINGMTAKLILSHRIARFSRGSGILGTPTTQQFSHLFNLEDEPRWT